MKFQETLACINKKLERIHELNRTSTTIDEIEIVLYEIDAVNAAIDLSCLEFQSRRSLTEVP